jgi:DNA processing protein
LHPAELIGIGAVGYPARLASIPSPPKTLWVRGTVPPVRAVAIVGTRTPTPFGRRVAAVAATGAIRAGLAVVSGLAAGIDTVVHESALEAGGPSWAVLGSGVDIPTPASNTALAEAILERGGGLIAEVPAGTPVTRGQLVARDRIQSGLSLAVVVCQCETTSAMMHTARFALLQKRLLVIVRPRGDQGALASNGGTLALSDPNGCDPELLSATGEEAKLIRRRRPVADLVVEDLDELGLLWDQLSTV